MVRVRRLLCALRLLDLLSAQFLQYTDYGTDCRIAKAPVSSLIITRKGGRTSHAAIIAREFGIPAIVGCSDAMDLPNYGQVTGSCAEGDVGYVYSGDVPFEIEKVSFDESLELKTKIKLNVGFPTKSLADSRLQVDGVGLARIEFILSSELGIHPLAFVHHAAMKTYVETGSLPEVLKPYQESFAPADMVETCPFA